MEPHRSMWTYLMLLLTRCIAVKVTLFVSKSHALSNIRWGNCTVYSLATTSKWNLECTTWSSWFLDKSRQYSWIFKMPGNQIFRITNTWESYKNSLESSTKRTMWRLLSFEIEYLFFVWYSKTNYMNLWSFNSNQTIYR